MDDVGLCQYIQLYLKPNSPTRGDLNAGNDQGNISNSLNSNSLSTTANNYSTTNMLSAFPTRFNYTMTSASSAGYAANDIMTSLRTSSSSYAKDYLYAVVNPLLAACGILGNLLSIIVLTQRRMQRAMDHSGMERAARLGLIALAVSDILFCVSTLPKAFVGSETFFPDLSLRLYVQIYGPCLERIFMRTSTWLTVIMAVSRFAAICHPLKARHLVGPAFTGTAIAATFAVWTLLHLPLIWTYNIVTLSCDDSEGGQHYYYVLDQGYFAQNKTLHKTFTYLWSIFGYVIPVALLIHCNVHLIAALRESRRVRRQYCVHVGRLPGKSNSGVKITPTLVAIVCMLIVLVSPAELIRFYYYAIEENNVENFNVVMVATNVLVTMNFGLNFVLYCIVNVNFRRAVRGVARNAVQRICCYCRGISCALAGNSSGGDSTPPHTQGGGAQDTEVSIALHGATNYHHIRICKKASARTTRECSL